MIDDYPNKFTIKELIDVLKIYPPEMRVVTHGQREGYENILLPEIINVYRNEEAMSSYEGEYNVKKTTGQEPINVVVIFRDERGYTGPDFNRAHF